MTTDTFPKGASATVEGDGGPIHIAGIAKGSGMIAPDMATMLVYIFTDAKIAPAAAAEDALAPGRTRPSTPSRWTATPRPRTRCFSPPPGRAPAAEVTARSPWPKPFEAALRGVMMDLAHQVVRDGEGATKFVEVRVTGAASDRGRRIASACPSPTRRS